MEILGPLANCSAYPKDIIIRNSDVADNVMNEKSKSWEGKLLCSQDGASVDPSKSSLKSMLPVGASFHEMNHGSSLATHTLLGTSDNSLPYSGLNHMDPFEQKTSLRGAGTCNNNVCQEDLPSKKIQSESQENPLKRYMVFDHSFGRGGVFLHSGLVQQLNGHTSSSVSSHISDLHLPFLPLDASVDYKLTSYYHNHPPEFAAGRTKMSFTPISHTKDNLPNDMVCINEDTNHIIYSPAKSESSSHVNLKRIAGTHCTDRIRCQENPDDIDALLSSDDDDDDDEASTCHFPPDDTDSDCDSNFKKRRLADLSFKDDYLMSSKKDSTQVSTTAASPESGKVSDFATFTEDFGINNIVGICPRNEIDYSRDFINRMPCHYKSTAKARRQKIKRTMKILRKVIPGAKCMDAAVVLDEAIQYLKSLQHKVQELDPSNNPKLDAVLS